MAADDSAGARPRVIFVGNPNVGKSLLFGVLTGRYVTVSNYPGTTVELTRGTIGVGGRRVEAIDTPGTNTLVPQSEDEKVARDVLLDDPGTILQVGDTKNLPRALAMSLELAEAQVPFVLCLNMCDEAEESGIEVDPGALSALMGIDVAKTVATRREGTSRLPGLLARARPSSLRVDYGPSVEARVARVEPLLPEAAISRRALALSVLSGDPTLAPWLRSRLDAAALAAIERERAQLELELRRAAAAVIQEARIRAARSSRRA